MITKQRLLTAQRSERDIYAIPTTIHSDRCSLKDGLQYYQDEYNQDMPYHTDGCMSRQFLGWHMHHFLS